MDILGGTWEGAGTVATSAGRHIGGSSVNLKDKKETLNTSFQINIPVEEE